MKKFIEVEKMSIPGIQRYLRTTKLFVVSGVFFISILAVLIYSFVYTIDPLLSLLFLLVIGMMYLILAFIIYFYTRIILYIKENTERY